MKKMSSFMWYNAKWKVHSLANSSNSPIMKIALNIAEEYFNRISLLDNMIYYHYTI